MSFLLCRVFQALSFSNLLRWTAHRRAGRLLLALTALLALPAGLAETEVPADWELVPPGVQAGEAFRLLFVTSAPRHALDTDIGSYNRTVQSLARRSGHRAIRPHWAGFRAVASTPAADAMGNTATAWTPASKGVPIHWLGGARVADDYADFYDGAWAWTAPTDESGARLSDPSLPVFTGTAGDGRAASRPLGIPAGLEGVRYGLPGAGPLSHGDRDGAQLGRLYALSTVFVVAGGQCEAVWCSSLTVGGHAVDPAFAGYQAGGAYTGARLEPARFDYRGTSYTVGGLVNARNSSELVLQLSPLPAAEEVRALTLRAGGIALPFAAATRNAQLGAYQWTDPATLNLATTPFAAGAGLRLRIEEGVTASPPGPPGDLAATLGGGAEIELQWTAPPSDGGDPVRGYRVEMSADHGASWSVLAADTGSAATAYRHAGLPPGATLHYRVASLNAAGPGQASGVAVGATAAVVAAGPAPIRKARERMEPRAMAAPGSLPRREQATPICATPPCVVPYSWSLRPPGLVAGQQFRLLFVTSETRNATSTDIAVYNAFVQGLAAAGHEAIRPYSAHFKAVASTAAVDARDNTGTTGTGVPIYWLRGSKAADDYGDFYDGSWDEEASVRDESGATISIPLAHPEGVVWTGSEDDGTEIIVLDASRALGTSAPQVGHLNLTVTFSPLNGGDNDPGSLLHPLYGLSPVFEVGPRPVVAVPPGWPLIPTGLGGGDQFRLLFRTSETRDASSSDIEAYNAFVQGLAAAGHAYIQGYGQYFRAVASTAAADARDNTETTYTSSDKGVPIYWLGGAKAADQYEDFYDGSWDEEASVRDESGNAVTIPDTNDAGRVWTGSESDGTEFIVSPTSYALGASRAQLGSLNFDATGAGPINGVRANDNTTNRPLYGLSPVFEVLQQTPVRVRPGWLHLPHGARAGQLFRLLFATFRDECGGRDGTSASIADYNTFVQCQAGRTYNHRVIRESAAGFRAVVSTAAADARDNTGTTGPSAPVWWVGGREEGERGGKVADDYVDFFDGEWDSESRRHYSIGNGAVPRSTDVYLTGSAHDGTAAEGAALGSATVATGLWGGLQFGGQVEVR